MPVTRYMLGSHRNRYPLRSDKRGAVVSPAIPRVGKVGRIGFAIVATTLFLTYPITTTLFRDILQG
ncbi:hypothetical protein BDV24DRAFT_122617 [Aspergillus arachidicola]|uniref:Uncharacterized protein n=1 Tax=Aspergillus arachidicola TaxID=656916 RepID=A0A5N6YP71_9EURO|nr:hypothetical protein BDV24DRAFT_122617 [Aspergillus arachidicola]